MGTLIDGVHRELTDADLEKIVPPYHLATGMNRGAHVPRVLFPAPSPETLHPPAKPHTQSLPRGRRRQHPRWEMLWAYTFNPNFEIKKHRFERKVLAAMSCDTKSNLSPRTTQ